MIAAHQRVMASKAFDWQMLNCVIESSEQNGPCGGAVTTAVRPIFVSTILHISYPLTRVCWESSRIVTRRTRRPSVQNGTASTAAPTARSTKSP